MVIVIVERDRDREGCRDCDDDDWTHCHNFIKFFGFLKFFCIVLIFFILYKKRNQKFDKKYELWLRIPIYFLAFLAKSWLNLFNRRILFKSNGNKRSIHEKRNQALVNYRKDYAQFWPFFYEMGYQQYKKSFSLPTSQKELQVTPLIWSLFET